MLIRNATVINLSEGRAIPDSYVVTDGPTIVSVGTGVASARGGRGRHRGAISDTEEILDAAGAYVIPGLVNLHAHTAMTPFRGIFDEHIPEDWFREHVRTYEHRMTPQDVYWGTMLGALEMLTSGVTCVADHYFHMDHAFRAFANAGMRANLAEAVFDAGDGGARRYEEALGFTREFHNIERRISVSLGPHSPHLCSDDFLRRVAEEAQRLGVRTHVHVAQTKEQVDRSVAERGKTPVEVLAETGALTGGSILAHAYYATDRDMELIKEKGATIAHCPKSYMKFGRIHDFLPRALNHKLQIALGTGGAVSNNSLGLFEVARMAALLAKASTGNPEEGALKSILPLMTAGGRALGLPGYGEVREGAPADLVLVRPSTASMQPGVSPAADLLYSVSERNVDTVIVDGHVIIRRGHHTSVDHEKVFAKNKELVERVLAT
ncbi:MAG: amidohydrolase family protein [Spirochaetales bacterium]